jgi:hypothetical protein
MRGAIAMKIYANEVISVRLERFAEVSDRFSE